MRGARRAPHLVPNPRPRTPLFVVPRSPALVGLYPVHAALAGLVGGLIAGPRATVVVAALVLVALAGAAACAGRTFVVTTPRLEGPASFDVAGARVAAALASAAVAVVGGAVFAEERLVVLDRTALVPAKHVRVVGFALEPPRLRSYGTTVVPVRFRGERVLVRAPDRVRFSEVRVGDELVVTGRLRRLRRRETYERRRGIHAVLEAEAVRATGRTRGSPVDVVRRRAEDALAQGLPPEQAALARGMVLGQDHALPEDLREAFRTAGLSHLLAASGQNVMLLAALVLGVATATGAGLRTRLVLALVAVAFYVPLAGAGPSIRRAGIMGAAGLVAALAGRPSSRWYALLLAAAVTLVLDPRAVEDAGWQLSFAAVIAILGLHRRLRHAFLGPTARDPAFLLGGIGSPVLDRLDHRRGWVRALDGRAARRTRAAAAELLADAAALTIAATIGTAPLICLHFETFSVVSLPANLLAAPAVAPVMWLGTLAGTVGGPAAAALNGVAAFPLAYLAWLGRAAASVPHAAVPATAGPALVVALYAAIAAACLTRIPEPVGRWLVARRLARRAPWSVADRAAGATQRIRPRWAVLAPLAILATTTALALAPGPPRPPDGPTLTMLDVGQGDALLLQDGERAALFDTGRPGAPLVRELRKAGVSKLDLVVITHSSADHEGGLPALLEAMPVAMVLDGRGSGREGGGARYDAVPPATPRAPTERGQRFAIGRIAVEVLWPPPDDPRRGDPNLTATVAVARTRTTTALLTADAESEVTLALDLPDADVLKVAHHGSEDEGLPELLERTTPRTALIPVGANTYGHPAPSTLAALRAVPDVRRADQDGTTRVPLGP